MNIGVIGSGFIVDVFVKGMAAYKHVNLYAIWGRHEEKIKKFTCFNKYYTNIDDFLNDENIDVVYVAIPNGLHFDYAYKALKANKHVLLEKPFCKNYKQAKKLVDYAKSHNLLLFETIMTKYTPAYLKLQESIKDLGEIKMINCSFCQYSRRYDKFKNGEILPAFDYKLAGGALMDLGVYTIHFVTDIFGMPKDIKYYPNIINKVDTSGTLILDYKTFKATLIFAKDCKSPSYCQIQGDKGYIRVNSTASRVADYELVLNDGNTNEFKQEDNSEFSAWKSLYDEFMNLYESNDLITSYKHLEDTLRVQKVLDKARISANIDID